MLKRVTMIKKNKLSYKDEDYLLELWLEKQREQKRITGGY